MSSRNSPFSIFYSMHMINTHTEFIDGNRQRLDTANTFIKCFRYFAMQKCMAHSSVVCECASGNRKCDAPCSPLPVVVVNQHSPIQHPPKRTMTESPIFAVCIIQWRKYVCGLSKHNRSKHAVSSRFWLVCRYADDIDSLQTER